jgi:hypothetical protein
MSAAEMWALYAPETRWDLYAKPQRRPYRVLAGALPVYEQVSSRFRNDDGDLTAPL